jgi:hypothetical protein
MRELLGGKGTISLFDCSAANAPNNDLYLYLTKEQQTDITEITKSCNNDI